MTGDSFFIAGEPVGRGERRRISINVAPLYDFTDMTIPVEVIRGKEDGPVLCVSAALHGDEINGVETIRRLLRHKALKNLRGTLIAVPIVNVFGFVSKSRYLPDRRDLNRSFPGSESGSLAARLSHLFMTEIIDKCTHAIDLHTGAIHRPNLPQIRAFLPQGETERLAKVFGAPVVINTPLVEGSLRKAVADRDITMLLFEGGEALRFEDNVIRPALNGILSVMNDIGMLVKPLSPKKKKPGVFIAKSNHWDRAPNSGIFRPKKKLGAHVKKGELLGVISDPFGVHNIEVRASKTGVIVGALNLPLVNGGDALFHVATFEEDAETVQEHVETFEESVDVGYI